MVEPRRVVLMPPRLRRYTRLTVRELMCEIQEEGRTKEAEGAALKRQISQQEAAHVLTEMASHYSSPSRASPLQVDVSGQHSPPHYPQISPTAGMPHSFTTSANHKF